MKNKNLKNAIIFGSGFLLACTIFFLHSCNKNIPNVGKLNISSFIETSYHPLGEVGVEEIVGAVSFFKEQPIKVLYRLSSREVLDISLKSNDFPKANGKYYRRSIGPVFLDGTDETIPKILLLGQPSAPDTVRNATPIEIAEFPALKAEDIKEEKVDNANNRFDNTASYRIWWKGHYKFLIKWQADGFPVLTLNEFINGHKNELDKND